MSREDYPDFFPPADGPIRRRGNLATIGAGASETALVRGSVCRACDQFNGALCETQFPTGCCLTTWAQFLATGTCPLGKWA
jgi:hypothetical protein